MRQRGIGGQMPAHITCATRGCEGIRYTLQPGELLGRAAMIGRLTLVREAVCPECGEESAIKVQVKAEA